VVFDGKASVAIFCPHSRNDQLSHLSRLQNAGDDGQCTLTLFRGRIKITSTIASNLPLNISETVRDRGFVPNLISVEFSEYNIELVDFRYLNSTQLSDDRLNRSTRSISGSISQTSYNHPPSHLI